ncbi:uncharacterized protein P174DRAFT_429368 [Aspergillus novofumigatus IBT 16806]|uniref:Uncharacterized protein n=1 Tax=Aspergillus novofumigatus (strain IBT 16806) TaxID=1392255 RepID=A0A2I1CBE7_ASPN1|nr:uncharacterized protein P174DRAFT_429368 [Aspergillus novofumigatus IBT 16806]PKX94934.1 hypothetical protein P174DRAFT_429368 [Aspergillus novofumigatus IBT 16806]
MAKDPVNQAHSHPGQWVHTPSEVKICLDKHANTRIRSEQVAISKLELPCLACSFRAEAQHIKVIRIVFSLAPLLEEPAAVLAAPAPAPDPPAPAPLVGLSSKPCSSLLHRHRHRQESSNWRSTSRLSAAVSGSFPDHVKTKIRRMDDECWSCGHNRSKLMLTVLGFIRGTVDSRWVRHTIIELLPDESIHVPCPMPERHPDAIRPMDSAVSSELGRIQAAAEQAREEGRVFQSQLRPVRPLRSLRLVQLIQLIQLVLLIQLIIQLSTSFVVLSSTWCS